MNTVLSNAIFNADGAFLEMDGVRVSISSKATLLMEGLCVVTGDRVTAQRANVAPAPEDPNVLACDDVRLVELAARYFLWANSEDVLEGDAPQDIIQDGALAHEALRHHQTQIATLA